MTVNQEPDPQPQVEPRREASVDTLLTMVVNWAEAGLSTGITVVVGGSVISGTLIASKEWAEGFLANFANGFDRTSPGAGESFRERASLLADTPQPTMDQIGTLPPPEFLHLRDAGTLQGGQLVSMRGGLWRVRVDQVSAWTAGTLGDQR